MVIADSINISLIPAGSVFPIWKRMMEEHGHIESTGPNMKRFFFSVSDAADLVIRNIDNIELFYECIGLKGDIDNSGYLNISDIILIVDNILMSYDSSQIINCLVDMNNDNVINIFDLINVIEKILEN